MKKIILVIFLFTITLITFIIYKTTYNKNNNILYIGELYKINNDENIKTFLYEKITYKELIKCIKSNDYIIEKNKKIYLNQLINNSDIIIIDINNIEYKLRCKRGIKNYKKIVNKYLNELLSIINKISTAKIYIIYNKCNNKNIYYNISSNVKNVYFIDNFNKIIK